MTIKTLFAACLLFLSVPVYAIQGYVDVNTGAPGCSAAVPDDAIDDYTAIQCAIDYLDTTYGGGILLFGAGTYTTLTTLQVNGSTLLMGTGPGTTVLNTNNTDVGVIQFNGDAGGLPDWYAGLRRISIIGPQSTSSTSAVVRVSPKVKVTIDEFNIWGGKYALFMDGVDGHISNGTIAAMASSGISLYSRGANWYHRVKFNPYAGQTLQQFYYLASWTAWGWSGIQEEHFVHCDFTGNTTSGYPISIVANTGIVTMVGSVIGGHTSVSTATAILFSGMEFGGNIVSNSRIAITASYGVNGTTVSGQGARSCAGNIAIGC